MSNGIEKALNEIKEAAGLIYAHGWGEAFAGNISLRLESSTGCSKSHYTELPDRFENLSEKTIVITASGSRMRQIASINTEDYCSVITINETGTGYYKTNNFDKEPSSELTTHLMLQNYFAKKNSDFKAVLHCHPDEIITLLHLADFKTSESVNKMLFSIHTEAELILPEGAGLVGLKKPGSYEFASAVFNELKKRQIVLLEKHGCFSVGKDLNDALDKVEFVNKATKIFLGMKMLKV